MSTDFLNDAPRTTAKTMGVSNIRVVKPQVSAILPSKHAALLKDIQHIQAQLGRLSECASRIYTEVLNLTAE